MHLYERIRLLAQAKNIPLSKLAEYIDVYPQKFNQWLTEKSQKNLWDHLPKILDRIPDIRPEWLYYGEEPMLRQADGLRVPMQPITTANPPLQAVTSTGGEPAAELTDLRRKLLDAYEANARLSETNARLTAELLELSAERRKLAERCEEVIALGKTVLLPTAVPGGPPEKN